ncbi:hypothetical protein F2P81_023612 [Scophthalmus maximus]|uniref:Uncharacterized protein n=1 Tax=Scophthalmus maximus TaxID=52904 RepID=A0A6A4RZL1_SCOMX|nr:hypothetical protein F2P81_023612 [Scophthalmus maximus]
MVPADSFDANQTKSGGERPVSTTFNFKRQTKISTESFLLSVFGRKPKNVPVADVWTEGVCMLFVYTLPYGTQYDHHNNQIFSESSLKVGERPIYILVEEAVDVSFRPLSSAPLLRARRWVEFNNTQDTQMPAAASSSSSSSSSSCSSGPAHRHLALLRTADWRQSAATPRSTETRGVCVNLPRARQADSHDLRATRRADDSEGQFVEEKEDSEGAARTAASLLSISS